MILVRILCKAAEKKTILSGIFEKNVGKFFKEENLRCFLCSNHRMEAITSISQNRISKTRPNKNFEKTTFKSDIIFVVK